jgi:hypothetical protein
VRRPGRETGPLPPPRVGIRTRTSRATTICGAPTSSTSRATPR